MVPRPHSAFASPRSSPISRKDRARARCRASPLPSGSTRPRSARRPSGTVNVERVVVEGVRELALVVDARPDLERLLVAGAIRAMSPCHQHDAAERLEEPRPEARVVARPRRRGDRLEPAARLVEVAALLPEAPHREGEPDGDRRVRRADRPVERGPDVVVGVLEPVEPGRWSSPVSSGAARARREPTNQSRGGARAPSRSPLRLEPLVGELADRVEQPRSAARRRASRSIRTRLWSASAMQAVDDVPAELGRRAADGLGGVEVDAARRRRTAGRGAAGRRRRAGRSSRRWRRAASAGARAGRASPRRAASSWCSSRARIASGERSLTRAAASSIASGRPSRRAQIAATAGAFSLVTAKSGLTATRPRDEQADRLVLATASRDRRPRSRRAG